MVFLHSLFFITKQFLNSAEGTRSFLSSHLQGVNLLNIYLPLRKNQRPSLRKSLIIIDPTFSS